MNNNEENLTPAPETPSPDGSAPAKSADILGTAYEFLEMIGTVTILVMLLFAFIVRLNIVDGQSMEDTLHHGEYLAVSDLFYEPTPGDIVIIHDITAGRYTNPIVKRVIATEGQTVQVIEGFDTWTLLVDGEVVDEPYRKITRDQLIYTEYKTPITVPEGEIFVMGDNRNHSADSRTTDIGTVDERCVVGRALMRILPLEKAEYFTNPYEE